MLDLAHTAALICNVGQLAIGHGCARFLPALDTRCADTGCTWIEVEPAILGFTHPGVGGPPAAGVEDLLIILLVCFSAPVLPTAGWRREGGSWLTRGEKGFLACLCVLLAVLVGALLLAGSSR